MQTKKVNLFFVIIGLSLLIVSGILLMTPTVAHAQCGSQASSCKNCHEVQGQKPVNNDGTAWHQSHAFGDFCYICHGGNQQATDKDAAHQGMVDPLSDVKAACQQCHVSDYQARAQVYATALGVTLGSDTAAPAAGGDTGSAAPTAAAPAPAAGSGSSAAPAQGCNEVVVNDPDAVNYAQNYDEIVLGKKPINWGNTVLLGLIGVLLIGGGGFVITREKLVNVKFGDTRKVEDEYPADVVDMLPKIAGLKAGARKSLNNVLDNKKADKVLDLMDAVVKKDEE